MGSVIKNPVRKIFLRRRLNFFITLYPLQSLGPANPVNHLTERIARKIFLSLYSDAWGRQVVVSSCFYKTALMVEKEIRYFNFQLLCRLLPEDRQIYKALLQVSILCRLVCQLLNHCFLTNQL